MLDKAQLLKSAANFRHGIILPPQAVDNLPSDIDRFFNAGIPQNTSEPWKSASGGVGRNLKDAETAAIGEALERYAAYACQIPRKKVTEIPKSSTLNLSQFSLFSQDQLNSSDFPYRHLYDDRAIAYTNAFSLYDNAESWVPKDLISLSADSGSIISTSSGLAAGPSIYHAILRALQEILERDALMITWLHSIPAQKVSLPSAYLKEITDKKGEAYCLDITQDFNPFPVAIVTGSIPVRGRPRISLGSACRESWAEAVEKAFLEWAQGVSFTSYYLAYNPEVSFKNYLDVRTFDDHAVYYTLYPNEWNKVALTKGQISSKISNPDNFKNISPSHQLSRALEKLKKANIRLFYRDLTTPDLRQIGVSVVRVLSPDLAPIHCDTQYPFLGGTVKNVLWRYPWAKNYQLKFPNPMPHPLG